MNTKERTRRVVTRKRVQEVCLAENLIPSFALHSKARCQRIARAWTINIYARPKPNGRGFDFTVDANNNVVFVGLFGGSTIGNHAKLECEFRGMLRAFDWLRHRTEETPCEIRLSSEVFNLFMGEAPCPDELKALLNQTRREYIASAESITIDRKRCALVSNQIRVAA